MQISWLGYNAFRITSAGTTVITNPYEHAVGFKIHKQGADIVVSSEHSSEVAKTVSSSATVITEPGEYEIKGVFINGSGFGSATLYRITIEDISIAFIGSAKIKEASNSTLELIEGVDILIVPVGGGDVCSHKEAIHLINQIEPRIVIPSYYKIKGSKGLDRIDTFTNEYAAPHEKVDKLKIVKSALPQEDTKSVCYTAVMIPDGRKKTTVISIAVILLIGIVVLWFAYGRPAVYKGSIDRYKVIADEVGKRIDEPFNIFQENSSDILNSEKYKLLEEEISKVLSTSTATSTLEKEQ